VAATGFLAPDVANSRLKVGWFDFKRVITTFSSVGESAYLQSTAYPTDVAQFVLSYTGTLPDRYGTTSVGMKRNTSLGDLTSELIHDFGLFEATASRTIFMPSPQPTRKRITHMPWKFSWLLSAAGLGIHGTASTKRGTRPGRVQPNSTAYDERVLLGDCGLDHK